jgi:GntR family histidine utilization transcriptional repressor
MSHHLQPSDPGRRRKACYFAVQPGGVIIFVARCYEGLEHNHPQLREWVTMSYEQAKELIMAKTAILTPAEKELGPGRYFLTGTRMRKKEPQKGRQPLYRQVKEYISSKMDSGELAVGMRVASENELVETLNVSRMTVNRALRELSTEGRLKRIQGSGTFVAERKPRSPLLEIRSIAEEIRARGGSHSCTVHVLQEEKVNPKLAVAMELAPYSTVFHSVVVHKNHNVPIQLGVRYINPAIAPHYLEQDFTQITASDYLLSVAPVSAIEHVVEALIPEPWIRKLLQVNGSEPCLALRRKTWVDEQVATFSVFYYPGSRYTLGSKFRLADSQTVSLT